jgi:Tfp pilus assembly PilM family ATPase
LVGKEKTKVVELMSIVGMELESKKVEMVKLKSQKEELRLNLAK